MARNHYQLLGVDPIATQEELDAALERRLKQFRVLTNRGRRPDPKALNRLRDAHTLLSDPVRRAAYDREVLGLPPKKSRRRRGSRRAGWRGFFARAWRGEEPAWKPFWFMVVPFCVVAALLATRSGFDAAVGALAGVPFPVTLAVAALFVLLGIAGAVLLWRCARNVRSRGWAYGARAVSVLIALQIAMVGYGAIVGVDKGERSPATAARKDAGPMLSPQERLLAAAREGDAAEVRRLLGRGAAVNTRETKAPDAGRTALHYAAREGHVDVMTVLLDAGADVSAKDARGGTPLEAAVLAGHQPAVGALLARGANPNVWPVFRSITTFQPSHVLIARNLLDARADPNAPGADGLPPLDAVLGAEDLVLLLLQRGARFDAPTRDKVPVAHRIAGRGYKRAVDQFLDAGAPLRMRDPQGRTLLHYAAQSKQPALAESLVRRALPVDAEDAAGATPLHLAVQAGVLEGVGGVLRLGANANVRDKVGRTPIFYVRPGPAAVEIAARLVDRGAHLDVRDANGLAPLDVLAGEPWSAADARALIDVLVKNGADVKGADSQGWTPLHRATAGAMVDALVAKGASVTARTKDGRTPLHTVAAGGQVDATAALLRHGAKADDRAADGSTPLHAAASNGNSQREAIDALIKAGADPAAKNKDGKTAAEVATGRAAEWIAAAQRP